MGTLWHDLKHGARLLGRNPGFAIVAVVTLALGIGGSTAIFSVVDGVLLRPLPYPHPDHIVRVYEVTDRGNDVRLSDSDFQDYQQQIGDLDAIAEFNSDLEPVIGGSEPAMVTVAAVTHSFFRVMGVHPYLGREFAPSELHFGANPVCLVSYGFWKRYLGGRLDFSARKLSISGHLVTIVGVMPRGFNFPGNTDLWFPREIFATSTNRMAHIWAGIARVKEGTSIEQAQAQATAVAERLKQRYGEGTDVREVRLELLSDVLVGSTRPALLILLGAVGLLLLVACANVANLLLAQAARRQRELAVRVAIGANRRQLIAQFVSETFLLSATGSLLGLPVAMAGVRALMDLEPGRLPHANEVGLHPAVLLFAAGVALAVALALGLITALRACSADIQENLKGSDRTQSGGTSSHRLRLVLMGAQIAVTLVLLAGAGLLGRSLFALLEVHPGFRTRDIVTMDLLQVWPETPQEKTHLLEVLDGLLERLRAVPGVEHVGLVSALPLTGLGPSGHYLVVDNTQTFANFGQLTQTYTAERHDPSRVGYAEYLVTSAGYFHAMNIPLLQGRLFQPSDGPETQSVALVSQDFAERQWPGQNPLGKMVEFGYMDDDLRPFTIVGVVGDIHDRSLASAVAPIFYSDYRQRAANNFHVVMQTTRPLAEIVPVARQIEHSIDPGLPVQFGTMEQIVSQSVSSREFNLLLLAAFALTALLVALMGVYGVGSYLVSQRTKEIGIRMALGAETRDVVRMITGEGLRVILVGAAIGALGALAFARVLRTLLFGVEAFDPLTLGAVVVLIVGAGLAACYVPARRAARVDPVATLREQ